MASILVIDDDEILCRLLANCLRAAGHAAQDATKGAKALHALSKCSFDWIVCDLFMPDMDGLEVIYEVRKRWPEVKIIAMSAGGWGGRLDMLPVAEEYGAICLRKPFPVDDLLALLEGYGVATPRTGCSLLSG